MSDTNNKFTLPLGVFTVAFITTQLISCYALGTAIDIGEDERLLIGVIEPTLPLSLLLAFLVARSARRGSNVKPFQFSLSVFLTLLFVTAVLAALWQF